jgi:succinate dehydrogenase / fumarate reductase, flavoprotein subunit
MYEKITGEDPYKAPMRIYPAPHYTMGGLWVDYNLESTIPGLFVGGEANFSDHGANRLGASALMQGLADGYFILPATVSDYLARAGHADGSEEHPAVKEALEGVRERTSRFLSIQGGRTVDEFHRDLGGLMWDYVGMARDAEGLGRVLELIPELRERYWRDVRVPGSAESLNQSLEMAGRVADFLEFGELMARDALDRDESAGGHYRVEHTTPEGEAKRNDKDFAFVSVWDYGGTDRAPSRLSEPLDFQYVTPSQRSYK